MKKILKNHGMWKCKSVAIFINNNVLKAAGFNHVVIIEQRYVYQSAIDFLMYVMLKIRLDFAYVVFVINRYVFNFIDIYWKIVKRIFCYIRETLDLRLIFNEVLKFFAEYIDVDWERKSKHTSFHVRVCIQCKKWNNQLIV